MMKNNLKLGVCDYPEHIPQSYWQRHAEQQKGLGLSYVRIAEFAWAKIEKLEGDYDWKWLDEAIAVYSAAGLAVILGTPTATPPAWLIEKHPEILPIDEKGLVKQFGSRRHYDHASSVYRQYARNIVTKMVKRYCDNDAIVGWQTDNELAHEGTGQSFGGASADKFPDWLAQKHKTLNALNDAWGTIFWSQTYTSWSQVKPPIQVATGQANPSHSLDYRRFCSDMVEEFQDEQIAIIREYAPHHFITHNFVIFSEETDLYRLSKKLDFVAWDSYPIGMLEFFATWESDEVKTKYARTGHPDLISLNHDIYRGLKNGKDFWVMEQQCGHANWAQYNPLPADNAVALWTAQAWAHGADSVVYFRWRAAHMAQEIMHSGLLRQDGTPDRGFEEVGQLNTADFPLTVNDDDKPQVVLLHDYQSLWAYNHQPHHQGLSYWHQFALFYSTFRRLGIDVDIRHPKDVNTRDYKLIVVPALTVFDENCIDLIRGSVQETQWLFGPRCGFKDATGKVPHRGQFDGVEDILGVQMLNVDSLRPGLKQTVTSSNNSNIKHNASLWCESYELKSAVAKYVYFGGPQANKAAVTKKDNMTLVGALSDTLLTEIVSLCLSELGIKMTTLPQGVRVTRRSGKRVLFNFNEEEVQWQGSKVAGVSYQFIND
jgi:beta-galactosidase